MHVTGLSTYEGPGADGPKRVLTVGSLFSGIGGFDLGLERAGMRVVWQCESDEFCRRVLARHWPGVPCYGDVATLTGPSRVDVLCGGFPCQDLSYAGAGAGLDGSRSGLWSEFSRLIRELQPGYVVVENVSALLARGMGRVLGDLAESGYDAEWDCIPACAVDAPHRRDRVWIVAYSHGQGEHAGFVDAEVAGAPTPLGDAKGDGRGSWRQGRSVAAGERERVAVGAFRDVADSGRERGPVRRTPQDSAGQEGTGEAEGPERQRDGNAAHDRRADLADADRLRRQDAEGRARPPEPNGRRVARSHDDRGWPHEWPPEPGVGRVADGIPDRMDRLRSLGNALVPQIAEWIGRRIMSYEEARR